MRGWLASLDRARKAVLAAGAIASALSSVVALVVLVWPEGGDSGGGSGDVSSVKLREPNMRRGEYCRKFLQGDERRRCLAGTNLDDLGNLFLVKVRLTGQRGPCCRIEWTIYEQENRGKLADPDFVDELAVRDIEPGADETRGWPIWVPNPGRPGNYYVVFDLYARDGHLDENRSPGFSVA